MIMYLLAFADIETPAVVWQVYIIGVHEKDLVLIVMSAVKDIYYTHYSIPRYAFWDKKKTV